MDDPYRIARPAQTNFLVRKTEADSLTIM